MQIIATAATAGCLVFVAVLMLWYRCAPYGVLVRHHTGPAETAREVEPTRRVSARNAA